MILSQQHINDIEIISGENNHLRFSIAPSLGGKIISIFNKHLQKEFLWTNENLPLQQLSSGVDYDTNFYGGIDELLPNDIPESIDGIDYPDHGELWTTPLQYELLNEKINVYGRLKLCALFYSKIIYVDENVPLLHIDYTIKNESNKTKKIMWKLHAALKIEENDKLITSAKKAKVVDLSYSRFNSLKEFNWPIIQNIDASVIPPKNNSIDFFYLYDIDVGEMKLLNKKNNHAFIYRYDKKVFPFQWFFASYGKFYNHYTAVLEPCSAMPLSVNEAIKNNWCTVLMPYQEIKTTISIYVGENI
jgi:hypothetical protein